MNFYLIPIRLIERTIVRLEKRVDSWAKNSLFGCSKENFLAKIATRLAPQNDYALLRIDIKLIF